MSNEKDYLTIYREFFAEFAKTVNPNDQLPVKLACYKLLNVEVVGGIIDWTTQYLTQKNCPPHLLGVLIKMVIEEIRKSCKKQPTACGFNPNDNAYEPLKLMQTVMAKTNEICLRYLDNSMLSSLPPPGASFPITSVATMKNSRRTMEDRHTVVNDLNEMFSNLQGATPSSYYAIFDGHAGHDAAAYSSAHLHQFLVENKYFLSDPKQALKDAFCKTDALFLEKCEVENLFSGTTAVCALLRPKEKMLYIAWVGDSQAILVRQGEVIQCVDPHKPGRLDEKERIESKGGCVILWGTWRVNGQLAVSRAIGDPSYKPYVTGTPDVNEYPLDGNEDFIVLACDGLWDHVTEYVVSTTVYNLLFENADDTERIGKHLVQLAKQEGSVDNISVIVVFLKDPAKIVADAHRANHNGSKVTMDASLDNANNPFTNSNGTAADNVLKSDDLLLQLTGNYKQNGTDLSPTPGFFNMDNSNGKRPGFDDDDFGPETDVDAVDDVAMSPAEEEKILGEINKEYSNMINNPDEMNKFAEQHQINLGLVHDMQNMQKDEFDVIANAREETPTPPADAVHDVSGLDVGESDSEDEWNYIKGDEANKEKSNLKLSLQPDNQVAELTEEDNMSQLNPNAAEFVPVSPTRSIPSPACRNLINDEIIAQSPQRATVQKDLDINLPNPQEFEKEIKSRPSDVAYSNGHNDDEDYRPLSPSSMLLNGKNIDDIPEFQPGSTPQKAAPIGEEFHFGPNAAPFTPVRLLDQSEAALSTKAIYGDESEATLGASFNESVFSQDGGANPFAAKNQDPMSMSFYESKAEDDELNQVQQLPSDSFDDFLKSGGEKTDINNDDHIQTTDIDKPEESKKFDVDDEKELASPVSHSDDFSNDICELPKSPEPTADVNVCEKPSDITPSSEGDNQFIKIDKSEPFLDIKDSNESHVTAELCTDTCDRVESKSQLLDFSDEKFDVPESKSSIDEFLESKSPLPEGEAEKQTAPESTQTPFKDEALSPEPVLSEPAITPDPVIASEPEVTFKTEATSPEPPTPSNEPVNECYLTEKLESPVPSPHILTPEPQALSIECENFDKSESALSPQPSVPFPESQLLSSEPISAASPSPEPEAELALSPKPQESEVALSPEPQPLSPQPVDSPKPEPVASPEPELVASPEPEPVASPIPEPVASPVPEPVASPEVEPVRVASPHKIHFSDPEVQSPEPQAPTPETQPLSPEVPEVQECNLSPCPPLEEKQDECKLELEKPIESPHEDITSSIKDDVSSPTTPQSQVVEEIAPESSPVCTLKPEVESIVAPATLDLEPVGEPLLVKTETIAPEFAEPAVVTPSENSEIAPSVPLAEAPEAAAAVVQPIVEEKKSEPVVEQKPLEKKPSSPTKAKAATPTSAKKPSSARLLSTTKAPPTTKSSTSRVASTTKTTVASKPSAKPAVGSTLTKTAAPKTTAASPKARTGVTAPKPTERKPLTNGDLKSPGAKATTARKPLVDASSPKTARPATATTKTSPTKPTAARPATAPRTTAAKPSSAAPSKLNVAAKTTTTASRTTTAAKAPLSKPSTTLSKAPSTTAPKARATMSHSSAAAKPKLLLSTASNRAVTKTSAGPDADKQSKETANKRVAATRAVPSTTRTTTTRKVETKAPGSRTTVTKTTASTTTVTKSATAMKKPSEIIRNASKTSTTKVTKIEKPKENGISTVVTEEITTVNNLINEEESLVKDNSPIDNKLIVENTLIETNNAD